MQSQLVSLQELSNHLKQLIEHMDVQDWPDFFHTNDPLQQLSQDIAAAEKGETGWRSVVDSACLMLERYWNILKISDRMAFIRNWGSLWSTFIHAIPYVNACRLQKLLQEGQIHVMDFDEIQCHQPGFTISCGERRYHADIVIEAAGLELDVTLLEANQLGGFLLPKFWFKPATEYSLATSACPKPGEYYNCQVCEKRYKRREHLQRHRASHKVSRPHQCACCDRTFQRLDVLKRHARTCEARAVGLLPQRRRACDYCVRQKKACTADQPCRNCERLAIECCYSAAANVKPRRDSTATTTVKERESTENDSNETQMMTPLDSLSSVLVPSAEKMYSAAQTNGTLLPMDPFEASLWDSAEPTAAWLDYLNPVMGIPQMPFDVSAPQHPRRGKTTRGPTGFTFGQVYQAHGVTRVL
ncbi:unnamed protein product [Parascedosporium putredinis]|uniref:Uncharacterized protein n=1 Tax=Parascedosporium putredinis TaxID=1442378 RepID=A0A9P1MAL0_9PEZI|nr:unnamed protein product [Parascedosporium putredinis]CAI7996824.1 unnamed protein product [Parascedosporium putredinis]